jgi:hypothetical protein
VGRLLLLLSLLSYENNDPGRNEKERCEGPMRKNICSQLCTAVDRCVQDKLRQQRLEQITANYFFFPLWLVKNSGLPGFHAQQRTIFFGFWALRPNRI